MRFTSEPELPPTLEEIQERIHYLQRQLELGRRILAQDLSPVGMRLAVDWEFGIRMKLIEASREEDRLLKAAESPPMNYGKSWLAPVKKLLESLKE